MPRPRAILFDAVGTLIDADPPVLDVYHAAGRRHGSRMTRPALARHLRVAMADRGTSGSQTDEASERRWWEFVVATTFDDVADTAELFEELWDHFADSSAWKLFDDVAPAWTHLSSEGYLVGVASNFDERLAGVCRGLPPLDTCQQLFWSSQLGYSKPHPEFFRRIEQRLGLPPDQIMLVGDDKICDFAGAARAGWHAVLLDRKATDLQSSQINSLAQLPTMLASLASK